MASTAESLDKKHGIDLLSELRSNLYLGFFLEAVADGKAEASVAAKRKS